MNNFITFFDDLYRDNLKPLSFTKPVSEFRIGISTIREKWEKMLGGNSFWMTPDYLKYKYPNVIAEDGLFIYGGCLPSEKLLDQVKNLKKGESIWHEDELIIYRGSQLGFKNDRLNKSSKHKCFLLDGDPKVIKRLHHLIAWNAQQIAQDFNLLTFQKHGKPLSKTINIIGNLVDGEGNSTLYIHPEASVEYVTINLKNGPVYIDKGAEVMEGSMLRGPIAVCENAKVNMGSRLYSGTTIGPWCKVGGEVNNVIFNGYSNKGHEGFLGDSVIGEWCNIGADSNNSNLKNDYSEVKLWNYKSERFEKTGRQFCGLIMGDHSKCGINTMFNTGTVIGIGANIAVSGFPRNFVPSFTLTTSKGIEKVNLASFLKIVERVFLRRNMELNTQEKDLLTHVFNETEVFRTRF